MKENERGVSALGLCRGWGCIAASRLKPKKKKKKEETACISNLHALNAIRYPLQEPAMMRL
jgi:Ni,Fe-hydrogenase I small subunit